MKKSLKVLSMFLFIILLLSNNILVYADDEVIFRAPSDGATFWQVESKTLVGTSYGSYRNGPQASNGITASMSKMTGTSIQYQHVLSGNYGDKLKIGNSFGVTFGKIIVKHLLSHTRLPKIELSDLDTDLITINTK